MLLAPPFSSRLVHALTTGRAPSRVGWVLIWDSTSLSAKTHERLIEKAAPFLSQQDPNWFQQLVTWDTRANTREIAAFTARYGRNTRHFAYPILFSIPHWKSGTPEVETWTLQWLESAGRFYDGCYPISGGWWSVDGDWNPSIKKVHDHLYKSPNHTDGHFQVAWLDLLKFEELQSLHSDHHREMVGDGKVIWKNVNAECPTGCSPQPMAFAGGDRTIRLGESTTLGGMPLAQQKYKWTPANSLDDAASSSPMATPTQTTTYTLEVENACGKAIQKVTVKVLS